MKTKIVNRLLAVSDHTDRRAGQKPVFVFLDAEASRALDCRCWASNPLTTPPPVVDVPGLGRIGLSICYDVRFPELFRHLADAGATVLMVPAAFTAFTGKDHWQVLLQARAIENTAYVVAPAQTGVNYGRRQTHGHALVIDPWGTVMADAGTAPGLAVAPIDGGHGERVRAQMPSLKHRRPALF